MGLIQVPIKNLTSPSSKAVANINTFDIFRKDRATFFELPNQDGENDTIQSRY